MAANWGCSVKELLSRVGSKELSEWIAYYRLDPFGQERADMRAAVVASIIANVNRDKKQKPYTMMDFMLNFEPPKQMSTKEIREVLGRMT